jgi:saccharopine dehydrogenase-like NADP-dependent oxidoreductase
MNKEKKQVLILGGRGRIGRSVAKDLLTHTDAEITVTGRQSDRERIEILPGVFVKYLALEIKDVEALTKAIALADLVIHCAGPFHYRDGKVLKICIEKKVNYIDVSDHRSFYERAIEYREEAEKAGITAILNTGIFPGISNSMVRQGVERLDKVDKIHLSYVVAGSGGAGVTVMRTTFLGLRKTFNAWINGKWEKILPYSDREIIEFPQPYGKTGVYWFDMPETYTFAESFPAATIVTKFGSVPDLYNHLTWITAHIFPSAWIESSKGIEFFSRVSYTMTSISDRFSGIGVAMRAEISGFKNEEKVKYCSTMVHENTAIAAGYGTGSVAQSILEERLKKPGIWAVEQALPTNLFEEVMASRGIKIEIDWL